MRVLVGCECSGIVRSAFRQAGHDAWSVDLKPAEDKSQFHIQDDVLNHLDKGWRLGLFHPPCTFLANAQVHLLDQDVEVVGRGWVPRRQLREEAYKFAETLFHAPIPSISLENPTGYLNSKFGRWTQKVHPWEHGEGVQKEICLWLINLPRLKPTNIVEGRISSWWGKSPSSTRAIDKGRSYIGIANAMAEQWGIL